MSASKGKRARLTVRLPTSLTARLQAAADAAGTDLNSYITGALEAEKPQNHVDALVGAVMAYADADTINQEVDAWHAIEAAIVPFRAAMRTKPATGTALARNELSSLGTNRQPVSEA